MGELSQHELFKYINQHDCDVFVETGTGKGEGLSHAIYYPFKFFFSIEINRQLYQENLMRFNPEIRRERAITLYNMPSYRGLEKIFYHPALSGNEVFLFWLDAHFPGADFGLGSYEDPWPSDVGTPILKELDTIFSFRPLNKDVFIIDDLQLFEPHGGDYQLKYPPEFIDKHAWLDSTPLLSRLERTHKLTRDYRHQGFLIAEPK